MSNNYTVKYSDETKTAITVVQQTENSDTSVKLVGRNSPNYGPAMAENFIHLLENFASPTSPSNPVEGQLWYDTSDPGNKILRVNDARSGAALWKPANNVHKAILAPSNVTLGDLWVDTNAQLLYLFNGTDWTLIGPSFSSTNRTGSYPSTIEDRKGILHDVIFMYLNDTVVEIIAKEAFTPVVVIDGFANLVPGINVSSKLLDNNIPLLNGISFTANNLRQTYPSVENVSANNFVRNDNDQAINGIFHINNNAGLKIGQTTATFFLSKDRNYATFRNSHQDGFFLFNIDKNDLPNTVMVIDGQYGAVGINKYPDVGKELDVKGDIQLSGKLLVLSTASDSLSVSGRTTTQGLTTNLSLIANSTTSIIGTLSLGKAGETTKPMVAIQPLTSSTYTIGTEYYKFDKVYANVFTAGTSTSALLQGNVTGSASRWTNPLKLIFTGTFQLTTSTAINGSEVTQQFNLKIRDQFITERVSTSTSYNSDLMLIYSPVAGPDVDGSKYRQISKSDFLSELSENVIPTGAIMPFSGISAVLGNNNGAPPGWLWCNGASLLQGLYPSLFAIIGFSYGTDAPATQFKVPNLNGVYAGSAQNPGPYTLYSGTATGVATWPIPINYIIKY